MEKSIFDSLEASKRWDANAELLSSLYTEQGDLHRVVLLNPALFELMESVSGKKILDAGCGEGYLSRLLANDGATSVTSVDYSSKMIEIAKNKTPSRLGIEFHHGNCEELSFLHDNPFDLIVSNMVFHDLADYQKALKEMYRLLVDGGEFVFSILHPCFVTPNCGWVKSEAGEKLHWKVDNYFSEGVYEQQFGGEQKVLFFHRTLTSYLNAIKKTGFSLESMIEPKPSEEMLHLYPSFEEDLRCADFIVFKLKRC
ncbi:MAG: class I SAM-dependent methyltransferase [Paenisporosarcina sp.]